MSERVPVRRTAGAPAFYAGSDDGSRLSVGERVVVDNDGLHSHVETAGLIHLRAGLHAIDIRMFEATGDESLSVKWEGPGFGKVEIPASAYFSQGDTERPLEPPRRTAAF